MVVLELREKYPLGLLLSIAGLQKSTYSYDVKHLNYKNDKNKNDVELVKNIFCENKGRYGRDRIVIELKKRGHPMTKVLSLRMMSGWGPVQLFFMV